MLKGKTWLAECLDLMWTWGDVYRQAWRVELYKWKRNWDVVVNPSAYYEMISFLQRFTLIS